MDLPNKERPSPENEPKPVRRQSQCCSSLKMFLVALSFAYFAKALSGSYMKSTITQLERRFDIPSYLIGVIDGSFEIGNLLVIAFVSYFGAKLHRPKIIAIGCLLMSIGTFLIALPHFIIGRYKFETSIRSSVNSSSNLSPCPVMSPGVLSAGPSTSSLPGAGVICALLFFATPLIIPQVFVFHVVVIDFPEQFIQCTTHGSFSSHWQETLYNMFTFTFLFLLPLLIMISCYSRILFEISKKMKDNALSKRVQLRRSKNNIPKARMRTLKMSVVIVLSFMVCWTPYYMLGLWYWFYPAGLEEMVSHSLSHILFLFGLLNACLDPIIYGLFTIPLCRGMRQRRHDSNMVTFELENTNNSLMTSLRCSASSLTLKRLAAQHTSREKLEFEGACP